jgi:hypothetical protein
MPTACSRDKAKEIFHSFNIGTNTEYDLHNLITPEFLRDWKGNVSEKSIGVYDEEELNYLVYDTFYDLWLDYDYNPDFLETTELNQEGVLKIWTEHYNKIPL